MTVTMVFAMGLGVVISLLWSILRALERIEKLVTPPKIEVRR